MDLPPIPGLDATEQQRPSIDLVSEVERVSDALLDESAYILSCVISQTPTSPTTRRRLLERFAYPQQNGLLGPLPVPRLEYTGEALFTGHEALSATFSNSRHSLAAQSGQEELDGRASANQSMDEGIEVENISHGAVPKRYTILRTCLNGKIVIVDGHTGNVVCTHKLHARLYSDVAIVVISLAMDDSDADSGAILVARLLDRFGAGMLHVCIMWNTSRTLTRLSHSSRVRRSHPRRPKEVEN